MSNRHKKAVQSAGAPSPSLVVLPDGSRGGCEERAGTEDPSRERAGRSIRRRCRAIRPMLFGIIAAGLLLCSLRFALWQMHLEAPQYRDEEALNIAVHPNSFRGDIRELTVLDHYIGVHIPPTLPQFKWLPGMLIASAAFTLIAAFLRSSIRSRVLVVVAGAMAAALLVAVTQAMVQMHDIGHHRDQKTILVGIGDFTPPFLGTTKIAQFTVSSRFGPGAWLIGGAFALQLGAAWFSSQRNIRSRTICDFKVVARPQEGRNSRAACAVMP